MGSILGLALLALLISWATQQWLDPLRRPWPSLRRPIRVVIALFVATVIFLIIMTQGERERERGDVFFFPQRFDDCICLFFPPPPPPPPLLRFRYRIAHPRRPRTRQNARSRPRDPGSGRPTKQERRAIDRLLGRE